MTYLLSTGTPQLTMGSFRGNRSLGRAHRRLAAAAMRGRQLNALNSAARQRAKMPGVSFAFFAARVRDRRQIRAVTAGAMLQEQRGATAIEMAMCLPVLLLLIIGLLQLGTTMLVQSLFRSSIEAVVSAVESKKDAAEAASDFCQALNEKSRVQVLRCKTGVTDYAIDVREAVPEDTLGRTKPDAVAFEVIDGTTQLGSVRFVRAYMELPVLWSAFSPVFAEGDMLKLYTASAFVYKDNTVAP